MKATRLKLVLQQRLVRRPERARDKLVAAGNVPNGEIPFTQDVVVSQVVPNYQSDSSDVVTQYNKLIAAKRRDAGLHVARGLRLGARVHRRPARAPGSVHAGHARRRRSRRCPTSSLGIGATCGLLADEPPVLEVGVGHVDPAGRLVQEPLLLERRASRSSSSSEAYMSEPRPPAGHDRPLPPASPDRARRYGDDPHRAPDGRRGLLAHRRGEAPAPRVRRGPRVRRDVPRRGAHRVEGPSPQRRARARSSSTTSDEVMLVQEYVHGVPLHRLLRTAHEASSTCR